jgi:hypothetical protein
MMTCDEARKRLADGTVSPEVEEHLAECEACLRSSFGPAEPDAPLGDPAVDDLLAATRGTLRAETGVVAKARALSTGWRNAIFAALLVAVCGFVLLVMRRPDLALYPAGRLVALAASLTLLTLLGARLALWPSHRPRPVSWRIWGFSGLAVGTLLVAYLLPPPDLALAACHTRTGPGFVHAALACLLTGGALGGVGLGLLLLLDRRDHTTAPRGWLLVATFALLGNLGLAFHCPIVSNAHLLVGHGGLMLLAMVAGIAWAVRRRSHRALKVPRR